MIRAFFHKLRSAINTIDRIPLLERKLDILSRMLEHQSLLTAGTEQRRVRSLPAGTPLAECEFRWRSQFGEDGILQHLIQHSEITSHRFVEFGVEDFTEANCRFLAETDGWSGLLLDSAPNLSEKLLSCPTYLSRNIVADSAMVTSENINDLLSQNGFTGDLGVLSIDIDGNDYWVWEAIYVIQPTIVVIEYNSVFGAEFAVSIPYEPAFSRRDAHYSWLYAGASLAALVHLGKRMGYSFLGSNCAGNNAFFVRQDRIGSLRAVSVEEGYVESTFRESRDREGRLSLLSGDKRLKEIRDLPLIDVTTGKLIYGRDILSKRSVLDSSDT